MVVTAYHSVSAFLEKAQGHLEENEVANSLMLGFCFRLAQAPPRADELPYFVTIEDEAGIAAAAVMIPSQVLIISCDRQDYEDAVEILAHDLFMQPGSREGITNVRAPAGVAETFAATWATATGQPYRLAMAQRAFMLTKVTPPHYASGSLRVATEADTDLIALWLFDFDQEALGGGEDRASASEAASRRVQEGSLYLWEDGRPTCLAGKARPTKNGITINAVYTPPDFRGRGYATSCVAALSQHLLESGWKFCTLFTDLANPTSNSIYQKIGYAPIGDYAVYVFGP